MPETIRPLYIPIDDPGLGGDHELGGTGPLVLELRPTGVLRDILSKAYHHGVSTLSYPELSEVRVDTSLKIMVMLTEYPELEDSLRVLALSEPPSNFRPKQAWINFWHGSAPEDWRDPWAKGSVVYPPGNNCHLIIHVSEGSVRFWLTVFYGPDADEQDCETAQVSWELLEEHLLVDTSPV